MENSIKVSVIIPVYNEEKYLRQCLDSVINQTLKDIEILCINDGSTDRSEEILREYEKKDKRIRVFEHPEESHGAAEARNIGLENARGKYLSILDSDDFFEPEMLEETFQLAEKNDLDIIAFGAWIYDEKTEKNTSVGWILNYSGVKSDTVFSSQALKEVLFRISDGMAWNSLFRTDFIRSNSISFAPVHVTDDQVFTYLAFALAKNIMVHPKKYVHYRHVSEHNQQTIVNKNPEAGYLASELLQKELEKRGLFDIFRPTFFYRVLQNFSFVSDEIVTQNEFDTLYYRIRQDIIDWEIQKNELKGLRYDQIELIKDILESESAEAFLLRQRNTKRLSNMERILNENKVKEGSNVVVYGAGGTGKNVFTSIINKGNYHVQAWLDRDFEKIGFPVQSPDVIVGLNFDVVLIAIENQEIAESVKIFLKNKGVAENKILWVPNA